MIFLTIVLFLLKNRISLNIWIKYFSNSATANKAEELLNEIITIEGAKVIGKFAIGTIYGVSDFTKDILFDEKIGGAIYCAISIEPPETGSTNQSAIHWDILKDMTLPGSKVIADGKVIYEEGQWES